jgi:hypothetical protein
VKWYQESTKSWMKPLAVMPTRNQSSKDLGRWQRGMTIGESSIGPEALGASGFGAWRARQKTATKHEKFLAGHPVRAYQDPISPLVNLGSLLVGSLGLPSEVDPSSAHQLVACIEGRAYGDNRI